MKTVKKISFAVFAALALFVSACNKTSDDVAYGKIHVTHASPDAPGVDLLVDGNKVNTSALVFPNSTGYLDVFAGSNRNIKVNVAGTTTSVINANLNIEEGKAYSIFAVDSVSKIGALVIPDNLTTPAAGMAHVRFVHLSPDAPAVDIALVGGAVVFPNKAFKQYTDFTPLNAGAYNLEVRVAGTSTVALTLPTLNLQSGKIYTVFAKGFLAGTGNQALGAEVIVNN